RRASGLLPPRPVHHARDSPHQYLGARQGQSGSHVGWLSAGGAAQAPPDFAIGTRDGGASPRPSSRPPPTPFLRSRRIATVSSSPPGPGPVWVIRPSAGSPGCGFLPAVLPSRVNLVPPRSGPKARTRNRLLCPKIDTACCHFLPLDAGQFSRTLSD